MLVDFSTVKDASQLLMTVFYVRVCAQLLQSCLFVTPWTIAHQAPLPMVFSRQEY